MKNVGLNCGSSFLVVLSIYVDHTIYELCILMLLYQIWNTVQTSYKWQNHHGTEVGFNEIMFCWMKNSSLSKIIIVVNGGCFYNDKEGNKMLNWKTIVVE